MENKEIEEIEEIEEISERDIIENKISSKKLKNKAQELSQKIGKGNRKNNALKKIIKDDNTSIAKIDTKRISEMNTIEIQGETFYAEEIIRTSPYYNYYKEKVFRRKHLIFLFFYDFCHRNKSRTAELLGISRQNFYNWEEENKDFKRIMREKSELYLVDRAEEVLLDHLEDNNFKAAEFVLKTKGGYTEKKEIDTKTEISVVGFSFKPMEKPAEVKAIAYNDEEDIIDVEE